MVRIGVIFLIVCVYSCVYNGLVNSYGKPRIQYSKMRIPTTISDKNIFMRIDTSVVYKGHKYFSHKENGKYITYDILDKTNDLNKNIGYIKFYSNGKLSEYYLNSLNELNRSDFNPKNSLMGGYYFKNNKLYMRIYFVFEGSGTIRTYSCTLKDDTLIVQEKNVPSGFIYIKENINPEYLKNWKPDW